MRLAETRVGHHLQVADLHETYIIYIYVSAAITEANRPPISAITSQFAPSLDVLARHGRTVSYCNIGVCDDALYL